MLYSTLHRPAYPPAASDWRRYRHVITDMYIRRSMTLKNVHQEMVIRYRFRASPRMYKQRFQEWHLYKHNCAGLLLTRKANNQDLAPEIPIVNSENGDMMAILVNTRTFIQMALQRRSPSANTAYSSSFGKGFEYNCSRRYATEGPASEDIWDTIQYGLTLLHGHKYDSATRCFDRACESAQAALLIAPVDMFRRLLMVLGTGQWVGFEDYRQSILDYTAKMAFERLGRYHPSTIILQQLRRGNCLERAAEAVLKCSHDLLQAELGPGHVVVVRFKRGISIVLRRQKEYQSSEQVIHQAISDSETHNGHGAEETLDSLRRLASLYVHQQRYAEAETVFVETLSRGVQSASANREPLKEAAIRTLQNLSSLARLQGHMRRSAYWARHEIDAALCRWGPVQVRTMLARAGHVKAAQTDSDEKCVRRLLDLCHPIWNANHEPIFFLKAQHRIAEELEEVSSNKQQALLYS